MRRPRGACGRAPRTGEPGQRDPGHARAQCRRLEPRRPRGLHERLREGLAHGLRRGRSRGIRLAASVRPLPDDVFRARDVARLTRIRGGARASTRTRGRPLHRPLQTAAPRCGHGQRAVHARAGGAGEPLADRPRSHLERPEAVNRHASGCALLTCALLLTSCKPGGDGVIALEGATLIDGTGRAPVKDAVVLIRNGHIEAVARVNEIPVPRGAQVVSLIGKTIIPGLIDAHAHVERWAVERYLAWGVTTVRDLGAATTDSSIALKNDLDLGSVRGPRMFTSGAMIDGAPPTYRTATAVRTREQARKAVHQRAVAGADLVKIYTKFPADLLPPLLDEASTLRLPIAAHLGKMDALTAARAGVASLV